MKLSNHLVVTIGELLIDFFCTDVNIDLIEGKNYVKQAGGAPANVSSVISILGGQAAFVGKVGNDPFGEFLKKTLEVQKVDTTMLLKDNVAPTTLAFVSLKENGERDFVFHRGADARLNFEELNLERIKGAKIIHFGSATAMLEDPFRETYFNVMNMVKENEICISFDPNYRTDLWKGRIEEFIRLAKRAIACADFVKVSQDELEIITGTRDQSAAIQQLHHLGAKLVTVTLGHKGTLLSNGDKQWLIESIPVHSIDSTGAGDAFVGAVLFQLASLDHPQKVLVDMQKMKEIVSFANKIGAIVCTEVGAFSALAKYDTYKM